MNSEAIIQKLKFSCITMVSHELRSPLTSILSAAELLQYYSQNWTEEKKLKYLQQIQESAIEITNILNTTEFDSIGVDFGMLK